MANIENIRKWVEALRSGQFEQTREYLCTAEGFCCLGVACEVAISDGLAINKKGRRNEIVKGVIAYDGDTGELPTAVADWLGLDESPALRSRDGREYSATLWNDEQELSFTEIADLIEFTYLTNSAPD